MALDFPASPSNGQTYIGPNGIAWVWDGSKWVAATTGSTAYAPITDPVFLGNPQAPQPAVGDADASIATTAFVTNAVATSLHNVGRNYIHNPMFNIAQRGAGPFTANNSYTADRWITSFSGGTYSTSIISLIDADRAAIGDEEANFALQAVVVGGSAAGDVHFLEHRMENIRRFANKTITLSFWAKATSGTPKLGLQYLQVFGSGGSPSAVVAFPGAGLAFTLSTTWTRYSVAAAVPSIAGKTFGTTPGTDVFYLRFYLSAGATQNPNSGGVGVQSYTLQLWGVQLELGSVATPLEKLDPVTQLQQCQRFYQTGFFALSGWAGASGIGCAYCQPLAVQMRGTPIMTPSGTATTNLTGASINPNSNYSFSPYGSSTASGGYNWQGVFTASADL